MKEQIISFNFHNSFTQEYRYEPCFIDKALTRAISLHLPIERGRRWCAGDPAAGLLQKPESLCPHLCPPGQPACIMAPARKVLPKTAGADPAHGLISSQAWWSEKQQKTLSFVGTANTPGLPGWATRHQLHPVRAWQTHSLQGPIW